MTDKIFEELARTVDLEGEELRRELPGVLARFDQDLTQRLVREEPEVFGRLVRGLEGADVARFVEEAPEGSAAYQDVLWTGLATLVEDDEELAAKIRLDITVNFQAKDCPMVGHLRLQRNPGRLDGGHGLAETPDLTITGPAANIVGLITGSVDPIRGFMQGGYKMEGSIAKGTRLAPVIKSLAGAIPGA